MTPVKDKNRNQEQFENSSRFGVQNDRHPDPHIVQSDRLVSKYGMGAWLKSVHVSKTTFSTNILLPDFPFPLEFVILHSTNKEVDGPDGTETKLNETEADQ